MHFFLSAGEVSGERYAAAIARHVRERIPGCRLSGFGGMAMADAGVTLVAEMRSVSVMGFSDIPARLPRLFQIKRKIVEHIYATRPDAVVVVDFPDFHLSLARSLARRCPGLPLYYVVPPQVWIWRTYRVHSLGRLFKAVFPIFRFEHEFLQSHGVVSRFFGHPLLDFFEYLQNGSEMQTSPRIGLFPGSRVSEIRAILPVMIGACREIERQIGRPISIKIAAFDSSMEMVIRRTLDIMDADPNKFIIVDRALPCDVVIAKSGTNNLELAGQGVPFVVAYATSWLNYLIGRYVVRPRFISLVNILADRQIVPEFIQHHARPGRIAEAVIPLLSDKKARKRMEEELDQVWKSLRGESAGPSVLSAITQSILNDTAIL